LFIVHCSLLSAGVCREKKLALFCIFFFGAAGGRIARRRRAARLSAGTTDCEISFRNDSNYGAATGGGTARL
jgi:hypothetical protein